jgi:hypothetical protein
MSQEKVANCGLRSSAKAKACANVIGSADSGGSDPNAHTAWVIASKSKKEIGLEINRKRPD